MLFLDRVFMGFGEGMVFPCQHLIASYWVPQQERAFLVTFMTSGQDFGSVLANLVSPELVKAGGSTMGPTFVFTFWGCLALLWVLLFSSFAASAPEVHSQCRASGEASWIQADRKAPHVEEAQRKPISPCPSWLRRAPCVWGIVIAHFGVNYTNYTILSWMPTFFKQVFSLDLASKPYLLAAPYLAGMAGGILSGRTSDVLIANGWRTRHVRKGCQIIGGIGAAFFVQLACTASSPSVAAVWMCATCFSLKMMNAGFWVNMVDVCPEAASTIMGLSNTIASIPGIVGPFLTQRILEAHDDQSKAWPLVFAIGGIVGLVGAAFFLALGDDVPLGHDVSTEAFSEEGSEERGSAPLARDGPHQNISLQGTPVRRN